MPLSKPKSESREFFGRALLTLYSGGKTVNFTVENDLVLPKDSLCVFQAITQTHKAHMI